MARNMSDTSPDCVQPGAGNHHFVRLQHLERRVKPGFLGGKTWSTRAGIITCAVVAGTAAAQPQARPGTPPSRRPEPAAPLRHAISVTAGKSWVLSRPGITQFWRPGPAASLCFQVAVNRSVAVGLGLEVAKFQFSESRFNAVYPGIAAQNDNLFWTSVWVGGRMAFLPGRRTNPYLGAAIGASRLTEALHRVIIDETRTTYYNVGGTTRLTASVVAGADIYMNRSLALELEVRGISVHNDPDLGVGISAVAGLRFSF
jgi:hypothetical protein